MVANALTEEMIDGGKSLVNQLDQNQGKVNGAFWLLLPEQGFWKLMISLDDVERAGPKAAYVKIQRALSKIKKPQELSLDDVALLKPDAPILKLMKAALQTGPGISGIRFTNNMINGQLISDAYIYRLQ
jgi:hypothetical protein